jgi:hypothetical protein
MKNRAAAGAMTLVALLTGCGSATGARHPQPRPHHSIGAAEAAINRAVVKECAPAQRLDTSINAATTIGEFASGVGGWQAQLTAAGHIPMTGVPRSMNTARKTAIDYAEANLALAFASIYDNPFGSNFHASRVKRGYKTALNSLQDVLNRCAAAGQ